MRSTLSIAEMIAGERISSSQLYGRLVPPIPDEFVALIQKEADLRHSSHVADLGCGPGTMACALSRICDCVEGFDACAEAIRAARENDGAGRVRWTNERVEDAQWRPSSYDLMIAFEAFHLFPNPAATAARCMGALKCEGALIVSWCTYEWEELLKEHIVATFRKHGIEWGPWGYQSCSTLEESLAASSINEGPPTRARVDVEATTSLAAIAGILVTIDKVGHLSANQRARLFAALTRSFENVAAGDRVTGLASYSLVKFKRK